MALLLKLSELLFWNGMSCNANPLPCDTDQAAVCAPRHTRADYEAQRGRSLFQEADRRIGADGSSIVGDTGGAQINHSGA
jgi:hypothetical protein